MFDPQRPTALMLGRYQPFHAGHKALFEESLRRVGQVCIAVRDVGGTSTNNPLEFRIVRSQIEEALAKYAGRFTVILVPNITNIHYGRGVGYAIEQLELPQEVQEISATKIRKAFGLTPPGSA